MSDLQRRRRAGRSEGAGVTACFCAHCNRVLYLPGSDLLFCPVCSSLVSRIEPETASQSSAQGTRAAD